jgi:phage-related protein
MKILKNTIAILVLIFISSCSKDDATSQVVQEPKPILTVLIKEKFSGGGTQDYVYDSNNKLTAINQPYFGTTGRSSLGTITYNAVGKIDEVAIDHSGGYKDSKEKYSYNIDGSLQKKELFELNTVSNIYEFSKSKVYSYGLNQVVEIVTNLNSKYRNVYNYSTTGNLLKLTAYQNVTNANPTGDIDYEKVFADFDDKKNTYLSLPKEYLFPNNFVNNPLKEGSRAYTIIYDSDGYPTKISGTVIGSGYTDYDYKKIN